MLIVLQKKTSISIFCLCITSLCVRFIQPLWEHMVGWHRLAAKHPPATCSHSALSWDGGRIGRAKAGKLMCQDKENLISKVEKKARNKHCKGNTYHLLPANQCPKVSMRWLLWKNAPYFFAEHDFAWHGIPLW